MRAGLLQLFDAVLVEAADAPGVVDLADDRARRLERAAVARADEGRDVEEAGRGHADVVDAQPDVRRELDQ